MVFSKNVLEKKKCLHITRTYSLHTFITVRRQDKIYIRKQKTPPDVTLHHSL